MESGATRLDFLAMSDLSFEQLDARRFPGLQLAFDALSAPVGATAVLNAANEEAVEAFLAGRLRFTHIHAVNAGTLDALAHRSGPVGAIDDLLALDQRARTQARTIIEGLAA